MSKNIITNDNMNNVDMQKSIFEEFMRRKHRDVQGFIELRPCHDDKRGIDNSARRWFDVDEFMAKYEMIVDYCRRNRLGCFVGVLPRTEKGRGTGDAVESGGVCWADIDDKDHGGRAAVWNLVNSLKLEPSVIVESGGGLHLYYFLREETPADDIVEMNERIAKQCGGDSCHDRARVLRLPTSYHQKNPEQVKFVKFVKMETEIEYTIDDLSLVFPPVENTKIIKTEKILHMPKSMIPNLIREMMSEHPRLNDLFEGIGKTGGDVSGTGYDFAFAKEAIWLGAPVDMVCDAVAYRISVRGKRKGNSYILRTVARAVAIVEQMKNNPIDVTPNSVVRGNPDVLVELEKYPDNHRDQSKRGFPKLTCLNLHRILTLDSNFAGGIRFNEFKNRIEISFQPTTIARRDFRKIEDVHGKMLRHEISRSYGLEFGRDQMNEEIEFIARENPIHPVRDYLDSLTFDPSKGSRLDSWLFDYCDVVLPSDDPETYRHLISQFGRKFLLSCVARIYHAGCKVDSMLILTGKQGIGKSTLFRMLARRDEWFRDSAINVNGGRDAYSLLSGVWIYEFPELNATRGRENEAVKQFITSTHDSYRPAYARYDIDVPRQVVFGGTSNNIEILKDPTGSRRFWVVELNDIDLNKLKGDIDLIWSEAVHVYKTTNENHWLSKEDQIVFDDYCEKYQQIDSWVEAVNNWFDDLDVDVMSKIYLSGISHLNILKNAIGLDIDKIQRSHEMRLSSILNGLKWEKRRVRVDGVRVYRWFPDV